MTVLERVRRRRQKAASLRNPIALQGVVRKTLRQRVKDQRASFFIRRRMRNRHSHLMEPIGPLEIDGITYSLMKKEVLDRIASGDGVSCPLYDAIAAMKNSREVCDTFAENPTEIFETGWFNRLAGTNESRKMKRRYQLMHVFEELEARPSACDDRVSSWEEVEEACRTLMSFPAESTTSIDPATSDNAVERFVQRIKDDRAAEVEANLSLSHKKWKEVHHASLTSEQELDKADKFLEETLQAETDKREERLVTDELRTSEERLLQEEREAEAQERASSLLRNLTPEEETVVRETLYQIGPEDDVIARTDTDIVTRKNIYSLQPGQVRNSSL